ncbi:MAG: glycosyltransferase [Lyngbya sp. HA4199-MV5]|nr:glycosyltransferase [Lyngbya sp. HA4199-MV5]
MNQLLNFLLMAIALFLFIPIGVLWVECLAAALPTRRTSQVALMDRPTIAVLVPAHDEAGGIGTALSTVLPQLTPHDRLIVIADNCTDETAVVAREAGATVIERHDLEHRGKGYALDFGLKFLASAPPDVVVVVDADCLVAEGAIAQISRLAGMKQRPVQASYLLAQPSAPSPSAAVSILAFTVKNLVRPLGLAQLGQPCLLTGTGMAFPWSVIHQVSWASGNIVEDMQLSLDLLLAGYPTVFCAEASVTGALPQQEQAAMSQRTRWEHGHLQTLLSQVPRLLQAWVSQKRFNLLAIALDLCVPPLSLLVMLWAVSLIAAGILSLTLGLYQPVLLLALEGLLILMAVTIAWAKFTRDSLPLATLLSVPLYILWKIPLYFAFLRKPQTQWVRTERDLAKSQEL